MGQRLFFEIQKYTRLLKYISNEQFWTSVGGHNVDDRQESMLKISIRNVIFFKIMRFLDTAVYVKCSLLVHFVMAFFDFFNIFFTCF